MRFYILLPLLFIVISITQAQETSTITGHVYDSETNTALPEANIRIKDSNRGEVSDFRGYFEIKNLEAGEYTLVISYIGYELSGKTVLLGEGETQHIVVYLQEKPITLVEEIVITAPAMINSVIVKTDPKKPRQPVPAHDGGDYLKNIPGFSVIRKGGTSGDPVFRGMAGSRLNILLDGQYILGGCGGRMDPPTAYIYPESYDRITIIKGPQSVIYGGSGYAGTVLFERIPGIYEKPSISGYGSLLSSSFGRNDQIVDITAGAPIGYISIIGTRSESGDYYAGDSKVHSQYNRWSFSVIAGWTPDNTTRIELSAEKSDGEAAYADRMMDGTKFDRTGYGLKFEKSSVSTMLDKLSLQVYYNYIDHVMDNYSMRDVMPDRYALSNPDRTTYGGRLASDIVFSRSLKAFAGIDYEYNKHTSRVLRMQPGPIHISLLPRDHSMTFNNVGVFGDVTYHVNNKNRIMSGARGDFLRVENERTTDNDSHDMFSAYTRYEHDLGALPITLYIGTGYAQRSADWWERNREFYLKPEKNFQIDKGMIYRIDNVSAGVSAFYSNISDFILVGGGDLPTRNIHAEIYGGEVDMAYLFAVRWKANMTLAYIHGNNKTDNTVLAQIPPLESTIGFSYDGSAFSAGTFVRLVTDQNRYHTGFGSIAGQDIGRTPGFATVSLNAGYKPVKGLLITAGVDNLFDKTYAEHISKAGSDIAGYDQTIRVNEPGRSLWIKVNYRL